METIREEKLSNGIKIIMVYGYSEILIYCVKGNRTIKRFEAGTNLSVANNIFDYACDFYME